MIDSYKTLSKPAPPGIFKDRGSKFLGYAFPVTSEEEIQQHINSLKKEHHKARHWCYAWKLGVVQPKIRVNDDGEPGNSAGQPIFGQILSFDLTDVLVVVVRYFGGTKLGVGGLINAYRTAAKLTLEQGDIIQKTIDARLKLQFEYKDLDKVMRLIKEERLELLQQQMEMRCEFILSVRLGDKESVKKKIENLRCVNVKEI